MLRAVLPAIVTGLLALACERSPPPSSSSARPSGPREVVTARPERVEFHRTLPLGGTLEAAERVEIAARIEGVVTSIEVELGDRVRRGETLARLSPEDFAARLAQTDAELDQARVELERAEQMAERDLASRAALEQARTKMRVAQAQQRLSSRQLRDTRVLAPFSGVIASREISPGAFVRTGDPLFVLVSDAPRRLVLDVPERFASAIRPGTPVRLGAELDRAGTIARIAPVVDPATRTFRAEIDVDDATLLPGMYARAEIDLGPVEDAWQVPRAAVFEAQGSSRVVEVIEGRARPREIELLAERDGVAIVRGVGAESLLVTRSPGTLAPDVEVRPSATDSMAERSPAAPPQASRPASGSGS